MNLPERIVVDLVTTDYIYTAGGEKLAMTTNGSSIYYRSVMVYGKSGSQPEQLAYMLQPEGLVAKENNSYVYKYFKTDHLGSTRVLLAARGSSLIDEQTTDFYPFGYAHQASELQLNKYLFSGKEFQDAPGSYLGILGMYDFGARHYMSINGRWMTPDPKNQLANPYIYCGNNPANFVDPDGQLFWFFLMGHTAITTYAKWDMGGRHGSGLEAVLKNVAVVAASSLIPGLTAGVGNLLGHGSGGPFFLELFRSGLHGLISGGADALQGGDFGRGFASGALSSLAGSGLSAIGVSRGALPFTTGGVSTLTTLALGGNGFDAFRAFWQGYGIGALNHTGGGEETVEMGNIGTAVITAKRPFDWQSMIPMWGSAKMAAQAWNNGNYFHYVGWMAMGVAEGLSLGLLSWEVMAARNVATSGARAGVTSNIAKTPVGRSGNVMSSGAKNSPTTINGTKFTGHALDQMQTRGIISPTAVIDVVKNPAGVTIGNTPGTTVFMKDNLKVVTNYAGDIVTVIWR